MTKLQFLLTVVLGLTSEEPKPEISDTQIDKVFQSLTPREVEVITCRALNDSPQDLTEVGRTFKVTPERIRQIEAKAIRKLRAEVKQLLEDNGFIQAD